MSDIVLLTLTTYVRLMHTAPCHVITYNQVIIFTSWDAICEKNV